MAQRFKKALVTGGAGFVGSHLVDALVSRRVKVFVVDDLSTGKKSNLNPNATLFKISVASPAVEKIVRTVKPDVVFHLAAQASVPKSVSDPTRDAEVNILGTLRLAHVAADVGVKKFVFTSTGGALFAEPQRPPYSERHSPNPLSPYGIAKRAAEMYVEFEHAVRGLPYVVLRPSNIYGPRQRTQGEAGVVAIFADRFRTGKPIIIDGDGRQTRDFVYVEDVVRANLLAASRNTSGIFHIGTGRETNMNALFRRMKKAAKSDMPERHGPARAGDVFRSAVDPRKARRELGWEPRVSLEEGLLRTMEWFTLHGK